VVKEFASMLRRLGKNKQAAEIEAEYLTVGAGANRQTAAGGLHFFWLGTTQNFDV